jgi:hypothetical protein
MRTSRKGFTQREIGVALNNAVVHAMTPTSGEIPPDRLRRLRNYTQAIVDPLIQHTQEISAEGRPLLEPEELTAVLVTSALFVHMSLTMKTDKLPMGPKAKGLLSPEESNAE